MNFTINTLSILFYSSRRHSPTLWEVICANNGMHYVEKVSAMPLFNSQTPHTFDLFGSSIFQRLQESVTDR